VNKPQPQAHWFRRLERSPWGLTIAALGGILTGLAASTAAIDNLLTFTGLKHSEQQNALMVARDDERARFSRDLTRAVWHRWFAMNRYVSTVEAGYSAPDQDGAWDRYATVFEEWNRDLMVNILSLEQHYQGTPKRDEFENRIQPAFGRLHACLEGLRRPKTTITCKLSPTRDIAVISEELKRLNRDLYCFVTGLPRKDDPPCFSDSDLTMEPVGP
jgi:hypothetical protein